VTTVAHFPDLILHGPRVAIPCAWNCPVVSASLKLTVTQFEFRARHTAYCKHRMFGARSPTKTRPESEPDCGRPPRDSSGQLDSHRRIRCEREAREQRPGADAGSSVDDDDDLVDGVGRRIRAVATPARGRAAIAATNRGLWRWSPRGLDGDGFSGRGYGD